MLNVLSGSTTIIMSTHYLCLMLHCIDLKKPLVYDLEDVNISGSVRSICFLEGLSKPALAVLFEKSCTWAGRLAAKRDTCSVVVLSLIMSQGRTAAIWNISGLPHDATNIRATPKPLGGLVALCNNSALYMNQNMVLACVGVNGFAPATVSETLPLHPNEVFLSLG